MDFKKGDIAIVINNGDYKGEGTWIVHGFYMGERVEIIERHPEREPTKYLCKGKILQMVHGSHLISAE